MSALASGLVHMEINRGDGSLGTFLGVQSGLAMRAIHLLGSEEQRERWLPGHGARGADGRLRADRARARLGLGRARDARAPRRRRLGHRRRQAVDRQRLGRGRRRGLRPRRRRRRGQGLPRREGHARLRGDADPGQGRGARDLAGRHHARRRARPGREQAAGREHVQGRRPRARRDARRVRVGRARPRDGGLRHGADVRAAARAVRQAAGELPDRPGPAGQDARRGDRDAALLHAARAPRGRPAGCPTRSPASRSSTTRARRAG